jgi:hypothetical protein
MTQDGVLSVFTALSLGAVKDSSAASAILAYLERLIPRSNRQFNGVYIDISLYSNGQVSAEI